MNESLKAALHEVAAHVAFQCRPRPTECCLTIFGGAAMQALGLRETSDVDVHISNTLYPDHQTMRLQGALTHQEADMTSNPHVFGQWLFGDLGTHGDVLDSFVVEGTVFTVRGFSPESLVLHKLAAGRDKDILDLDLLSPLTSPEQIMQRLVELLPFQDKSHHRYLTSATLSEISLLYWLDEPDYQPKMAALIDTIPDRGLQRSLRMSFGLASSSRQATPAPSLH